MRRYLLAMGEGTRRGGGGDENHMSAAVPARSLREDGAGATSGTGASAAAAAAAT